MWTYERRLEYPVNIKTPNAKLAKVIISQLGGPDGELGAAMRYLSQRYSNTNRKVAGVLTDIGIYVSVETIVSTPVKYGFTKISVLNKTIISRLFFDCKF